MPKALYKVLVKASAADGNPNPNPIVWTPGVSMHTSAQVSDYFLCTSCEQRFSGRGEKWVLERCWRSDSAFRLQDVLASIKPDYVGKNNLAIYHAATIRAIDVAQLVYFAASVIWRAAARTWSPIAGHVPVKLELGPYEEELRRFLLDEIAFPRHAALLVTVSATKDEGANEGVLFPYHSKKESGCNQYRFWIPGITFQFFVGKSMTASLRACCLAQSAGHLIFYGPNDFIVSDMWKLMQRGQRKGALSNMP